MTFERTEKKYIITPRQQQLLLARLAPYMQADAYGSYSIANLYYDTPGYELIRTSIEKPVYKEKLRLRGYGKISQDSTVYLELKKKYRGVVYKRRADLPYARALEFLAGDCPAAGSQVLREIGAFTRRYPVTPRVYLRYDRTALTDGALDGVRITFDSGIRFRQLELRLDNGDWGQALLPGRVLMEIKVPGAMPLWLAHLLSDLAIFPVSFSKYGTCYTDFILPQLLGTKGGIASA